MRAQRNVQLVAGSRKGQGIGMSVGDICHEHASKKHHFRHQKDPHPQGRGFLLLPGCFKMMPYGNRTAMR